VPSHFRRLLSGLELSRGPGEGEKRLDAVCSKNGWQWGIVSTYDREGNAVTAVLVGAVFEAQAEHPESLDPYRAWSATDAALGALAEHLGRTYGGET